MNGIRLKTRYVLTVLLVGLLLSGAVAVTLELSERLTARPLLIVGVGIALTLLAAWLTTALINRIDRAMTALTTSADRIGRGEHAEPVPPCVVPEISALEAALERMRQTLAGTTISRDYLDTVLNSMSDAVLVTAPDGRIRTVNSAATGLLGRTAGELIGVEFESLVAEPPPTGIRFCYAISIPSEHIQVVASERTRTESRITWSLISPR